MRSIELYNPSKTYIFQDGKIADYNALKELFPVLDIQPYIVTTDYTGNIIISMQLLNLARTDYNIDPELNDEEAIEAIRAIIDKESDDISSETRIADALEDLVVLNMPDEEVIE